MVKPNVGTWAALTAQGIKNRIKPGNGSLTPQSTATEAALIATWTRTSLTENEVVLSPLGFLHTCSRQSTIEVDRNWEGGSGRNFFLMIDAETSLETGL